MRVVESMKRSSGLWRYIAGWLLCYCMCLSTFESLENFADAHKQCILGLIDYVSLELL